MKFTPNGLPCSACGMSDAACRAQLFEPDGHTLIGPCCEVCAATQTHGQDLPGYVPPWGKIPRDGVAN